MASSILKERSQERLARSPLNDEAQKKIARLEKRVAVLERKGSRVLDRPETSKGAQGMVRTLLSNLSPMDVVGCDLVRVGRAFDGGYVMAPLVGEGSVAYSLGINRDVSWDLELAEQGYQLFQYDHTIEGLPRGHSNFNFKKNGIAASYKCNDVMVCLNEEIAANHHEATKDMILKMDIEGDEWEVLSDLDQKTLRQFSQILVEFHNLHKAHKLFWYRTALEALRGLSVTHQSVHVHGNNNSTMRIIGGYAVPPVLEVTFLNRDRYEFAPCTRTFPTALDQPNNPTLAEHYLGCFQFG